MARWGRKAPTYDEENARCFRSVMVLGWAVILGVVMLFILTYGFHAWS